MNSEGKGKVKMSAGKGAGKRQVGSTVRGQQGDKAQPAVWKTFILGGNLMDDQDAVFWGGQE